MRARLRGLRARFRPDSRDAWGDFDRRARRPGQALLEHLPDYPRAVLVAGCQRSGTRLVARLIADAGHMNDCRSSPDPELAAARLLRGETRDPLSGRCCFQTTYLDDRYTEYLEHTDFHLVWVIREPTAVIRSMLYNWYAAGLNRLFEHCGQSELNQSRQRLFSSLSALRLGPLERACLGYNAKTDHIAELSRRMPPERLTVIDYDDLRARPETVLSMLAQRIGYESQATAEVAGMIRPPAAAASRAQLSARQHRKTMKNCRRHYLRACACLTPVAVAPGSDSGDNP